MTPSTPVPYRPDDRHDVTPWIIGQDSADVIAWLQQVFDAEEIDRMVDDQGHVGHAEVRIGDSVVMLFDKPDWPPTPAFLRIYCRDIHQTHERAVAAGGTSITRPTHLFWGDLAARVGDPWGNVYWLNQQVEQPDEDEMARRMDDPVFARNMAYVTSAQIPLPHAR